MQISSKDQANVKHWLKKQPFFETFSNNELSDLATLSQFKSFVNGEIIVEEGVIVDCIYLITSGESEVRVGDKPVATLKEGESIGLSRTGFYSQSGLRTATVIAIT